MADWQIERLDQSHERGDFCCGKALLDDFLRARAGQYERRNVGRTYVAVRPGEKRVLGYCTLAAGALELANLPRNAAKKLPKHPVPVALLGRLAVDRSMQGRGLGADLLFDAFKRCLLLADVLGIHAVEVTAIDEEAKTFYLKYGFVALLDQDLHLYLSTSSIKAGLGEGDSEA
jgi:GNAT superfamily N-acetyltransferase